MFKITKNQLYKYNQTDIPYHRLGKVCRYLYSEVMNWAMNKDVAIVDEPERHRILGLGELPRCWPPEVWPELPNTEN